MVINEQALDPDGRMCDDTCNTHTHTHTHTHIHTHTAAAAHCSTAAGIEDSDATQNAYAQCVYIDI